MNTHKQHRLIDLPAQRDPVAISSQADPTLLIGLTLLHKS
jgi:hypothetical protein